LGVAESVAALSAKKTLYVAVLCVSNPILPYSYGFAFWTGWIRLCHFGSSGLEKYVHHFAGFDLGFKSDFPWNSYSAINRELGIEVYAADKSSAYRLHSHVYDLFGFQFEVLPYFDGDLDAMFFLDQSKKIYHFRTSHLLLSPFVFPHLLTSLGIFRRLSTTGDTAVLSPVFEKQDGKRPVLSEGEGGCSSSTNIDLSLCPSPQSFRVHGYDSLVN
jgi:hypothetical protein